jgi:nicotinate dehydrogenase subunit B
VIAGAPTEAMAVVSADSTEPRTAALSAATSDRRGFLLGSAGLMVTMALPVGVGAQSEDSASAAGDGLPRHRLDSWLTIDPQGRVTASVGKIDAGLGIPTAFAQIVAEELDVALDQVHIRMGDTATTVDQRGTGSSNGITEG